HHWNLADHFGFNSLQRWRLIEWPQIREALPGIGLLIFMLCLTSFAVVLTLGGGPKSTTLEVAIYQSLRFEFEPGQAVILALLQLMLCLLVAFFSHYFQSTPDVEISPDSGLSKRSHRSPIASLIILLAGIYVCLPLISMLIDAATGPVWQVITESKLWLAAFYSLAIGLSASLLSVTAGWFLLTTSSQLHNQGKKFQARWIEMAGSIVYVVPPLVIGTGYFVLLAPHVNVFEWVFPMVIGINAVMGLPFVIRSLGPAMRQHRMRYDKLCASLQITGWNRWIKIDWPMLRRPIALSLALVCALAMGDLGVIALFGTTDNTTLPLLLYQQLSAYLIPQAAVTAVMLLLFCLGMYVCIERLAGGKHDG
ncbi:MAG: thiamine transport system permease protein, partial [Gammaproteobacteria bacterium]